MALLSTEQAAKLLGVDSSMVRRYIKAGSLRAEQVGKRSWAIEPAEVERFLTEPRVRKPWAGRKPKNENGASQEGA